MKRLLFVALVTSTSLLMGMQPSPNPPGQHMPDSIVRKRPSIQPTEQLPAQPSKKVARHEHNADGAVPSYWEDIMKECSFESAEHTVPAPAPTPLHTPLPPCPTLVAIMAQSQSAPYHNRTLLQPPPASFSFCFPPLIQFLPQEYCTPSLPVIAQSSPQEAQKNTPKNHVCPFCLKAYSRPGKLNEHIARCTKAPR